MPPDIVKSFAPMTARTNIDREHTESYGSWDALQLAFVDFAEVVRSGG